MNPNRLFSLSPPHLHLLVATASDVCDLAWSLQSTPGRQNVVRLLRGKKSRTVEQLFNEMAAALQFPYYFGENWNALDECLSDLDWLPGDGYVLFFTDCHRLLDEEPDERFALLLDRLENSAIEWARAEIKKPARPARPFHVVFQCTKRERPAFLKRIHAAERTLPEWR